MNRLPVVEYLDYSLKMTGKRRDNILMRNLFVLFSSLEMVAQTRMYGILYVSIFIGFRWLAGRTHELSEHPVGKPPEKCWGALSMGRVADHILHVLKEIIADPSLFVSEKYMMNIYSVFLDELPPFKQYWMNLFGNQKTRKSMVNKFTGLHIAHISMAVKELFRPRSKTNRKSTPTMLDVTKVVLITMKDEMVDVRKSTYFNLSVSGNQRSYKHSSKQDKIDSLNVHTTNDLAESLLGGATRVIQVGSTIGLHRAATQDAAQRSGYMNRIELKDKEGKMITRY